MDQRIGQLMRSGKPVFYAYLNGYDQPAVEGTLEQVEAYLGLRSQASLSSAPPKARRHALKTYAVTVTPKIMSYAGSQVFGEYTVEVDATSHAEAIKMIRAARRDEEGRFAVPVNYRARLRDN